MINPNNPRQNLVPVSELVNEKNPQRDGPVLPHDPKLTRMANLVRYMRTHEMYMPPNPWPEAMLLYGLSTEGKMACAFFMLLSQFEEISEADLFSICDPDARRLYFSPAIKMPPTDEAAQTVIQEWFKRTTVEEMQKMTLYLNTNGWWLDKSELSRGLS